MKKIERLVQKVVEIQNAICDGEISIAYPDNFDGDYQTVATELAKLFSPVGTPIMVFGSDVDPKVLAETVTELVSFANRYEIAELREPIEMFQKYLSKFKL